jgi:hypothetical protein
MAHHIRELLPSSTETVSQNSKLGPTRSNCKYGFIRRHAYISSRSGKKIKVKSSCIKEQGKEGSGRNRSRKLKVIPVLRKGSMEGYSTKSPLKTRHSALKRTLRKYGFSSTIKKLNVLNVYNKTRNPKVSKTAIKDMNYIRKLSHHRKNLQLK